MEFTILDIFPNASRGLNNIGFIFGAGTSKKAGYPLMPSLTISVLQGIQPDDLEKLDELIFKKLTTHIDVTKGNPNIEIISDILESAILTIDRDEPNYEKYNQIKNQIRDLIVECLKIESPDLSDHIRFFDALNHIFSGRSQEIWIFTPNYDLLFEIAASKTKALLQNGFVGSSLRFFNNKSFNFSIGSVDGTTFSPYKTPVFKLLKLHGSLDWWKSDDSFYSTENKNHIPADSERVMILPRKRKEEETLDPPYNDIFRYSDQIIGSQCQYLVSCGYSFGDAHINDKLLFPKLQENKIRLTAFSKEEPPSFKKFKSIPSFFYGTESSTKKESGLDRSGSELWQFEKLVDLLCEHAGL